MMGDAEGLGVLLGGYGSDADSDQAHPSNKVSIHDIEKQANKDQPSPPIDHPHHASPVPPIIDNSLQHNDASTRNPIADTQPYSNSLLASLPSELSSPPDGQCDPEIQERVSKWIDLQQQQGRYITDELRRSRAYRNPEFFKKMVEYWDIHEYGTLLHKDIFDPDNLPESDTISSLLAAYVEEEQRRRQARVAGAARIEFTKGSSVDVSATTASQIAVATAKAAAIAAIAGRRR